LALAGRLSGIERFPDEQSEVSGSPLTSGEEVRVQVLASVSAAERVTVPPPNGWEAGVAVKSVTVGTGLPATLALVAAFTDFEPVAERLNV